MLHFTFDSFITGHHIYKDVWDPVIGEIIQCRREPSNKYDNNAVMLFKENLTIGHVPRQIAPYCAYILLNCGTIEAEVTGRRENQRRNGLEVPCTYRVKGLKAPTEKGKKCIVEYLERKNANK